MYPQKISSQCQFRTQLLGHGSCHLSGLSDAKPGLEMKSTKSLTKWISHVDFQCWKEWPHPTGNRKKLTGPSVSAEEISTSEQHNFGKWATEQASSHSLSQGTQPQRGGGSPKNKKAPTTGPSLLSAYRLGKWRTVWFWSNLSILQSSSLSRGSELRHAPVLPVTQNQGVRQKWVCLKIMQKHTRMMMSENYVDKKTYIYMSWSIN